MIVLLQVQTPVQREKAVRGWPPRIRQNTVERSLRPRDAVLAGANLRQQSKPVAVLESLHHCEKFVANRLAIKPEKRRGSLRTPRRISSTSTWRRISSACARLSLPKTALCWWASWLACYPFFAFSTVTTRRSPDSVRGRDLAAICTGDRGGRTAAESRGGTPPSEHGAWAAPS